MGIDPERDVRLLADNAVSKRFLFLNHSETLVSIDWTKCHVGRLWNYNLHYFDYAVDLAWSFRLTGDPKYPATFEALASDWISATTEGTGDGWDPYPISVRTVNWIYALTLFDGAVSPEFTVRVESSVFRQLSFLQHRIEWHLLGNHVFRNLKALVVGGLYFGGNTAKHWRSDFAAKLWRQATIQVNKDGGHCEASPMYHAIVLADLLELIHLLRECDQPTPSSAIENASLMLNALGLLSRQDGTLHLINDSASNVAPSLTHLRELGARVLGPSRNTSTGAWTLPETGYHGYRDPENGSDLVIGCREPRPEYQPGHSHCDILSFEWDVGGKPVIVDSGVRGYDGDPFREYVRSTRAHNTVVIASKDQSEAWATFRFARRATEARGSSAEHDGRFSFEGSYRPYHDAACVHHRTITADADGLAVVDQIGGQRGTLIESFLHFHPSFSLSVSNGMVLAVSDSMYLTVAPFGVDDVKIQRAHELPKQGWYCPEFGRALAQFVLVMQIERNREAEFGYRIRPQSRRS